MSMKYLITVLLLVASYQSSAQIYMDWEVIADDRTGVVSNTISTVSGNLDGGYALSWTCIAEENDFHTNLVITRQQDKKRGIKVSRIRGQVDANPLMEFSFDTLNSSRIELSVRAMIFCITKCARGRA